MADSEAVSIFEEVEAERRAQLDRWGEQRHYDDTGGDVLSREAAIAKAACQAAAKFISEGPGWRLILNEEVAEAFAEHDPAPLRAELIQVAAVAVAWIEDIDSRQEPET